MVLHDYRAELDLEFRWLNETPEELIKAWDLYLKAKKAGDQINRDDPKWSNMEEENYRL